MKIQDGLIYSIVDLPPNISLDAVDGIVNDFKETFLSSHPNAKVLIRMKALTQLHKAEIELIEQLQSAIENIVGELVIAEVSDAVENALKHLGLQNKILIFKTMMDFEKSTGIEIIDVEDFGPDSNVAFQSPPESDFLPHHVMIIESALTSRNNCRTFLKNLLIKKISEAKDCNEALRILRSGTEKLDVILLNIAQAESQGVAFIKSLRSFAMAADARCFLLMADRAPEQLVKDALIAGATGKISSYGSEKEFKELFSKPS